MPVNNYLFLLRIHPQKNKNEKTMEPFGDCFSTSKLF